LWCFELPSPRNAQKRTKTNGKKKKSGDGWVGLRFSKCTGGGPSICFLPGPSLFFAAANVRHFRIFSRGAEGKKIMKATYIWQMINYVGRYLLFVFNFVYGVFVRFSTRGVQKHH
jgi:hypothetical protein